jgi:hypothetical protein
MQLFIPIQHAITEDGEWVTARELPVDYMGRLKCDGCHASVVAIENKSGEEEFVHLHHNLQEITRTRRCRYAIRTPAAMRSPDTGMAISRPIKAVTQIAPIPPIGPRILRISTTVRKWQCILCKHHYYGTKQCPLCSEWTYTLEDNG